MAVFYFAGLDWTGLRCAVLGYGGCRETRPSDCRAMPVRDWRI